MSNRTLDRYLERENYRNECACCECGYLRSGAHHPKIRCPKTGRCGSCGNDWPCAEHAPPERATSVVMWRGFGVVSPAGLSLEGWGARSASVLERFFQAPRGSRLVMITARLETVTRRQFEEAGEEGLGFVDAEKEDRRGK